MKQKKLDVFDYLLILFKWKKLILINFFSICIVVAILSLMIPKWFKSTAVILPPSAEGGGMGLSSLISGGLSSLGGLGGMAGAAEEAARFMSILESRTLKEKVINEFNLIEHYNAENLEGAIKSLSNRLSMNISDNGTIEISVMAKTPWLSSDEEDDETRKLATDITNFIVATLDEMNTKFKVQKARNTRIFLEKRYQQAMDDLKNIEERFNKFQKKNKAIALPEQTEAAITVMAELKAQIAAKEIERDLYKQSLSPTHPSLMQVQKELRAMRNKYNDFLFKSNPDRSPLGSSPNDTNDIFIPVNELPDVALEYGRLFRDLTINEKLLEILLPEYEQARIQEAKDTPTVQVLDPAVPPILRDSPKRAILVILAGFMSLLFSIVFILTKEYIDDVKQTDYAHYQKITKVTNEVKHFFKKRK